jgi:hypothetical protein
MAIRKNPPHSLFYKVLLTNSHTHGSFVYISSMASFLYNSSRMAHEVKAFTLWPFKKEIAFLVQQELIGRQVRGLPSSESIS